MRSTSRWSAATVTLTCAMTTACGDPADAAATGTRSEAFSTICGTSSAPISGIDVARYEGDVNWATVRDEGIAFGFARTTNGTSILDEWFERNWREMRDAGVVRGAYQYFRPGQDPIAQADEMLSMIDAAGGLLPEDLPPVLDLETDDGLPMSTVTSKAQAWLTHVEALTGKRPLVYSAAYFGDGTMGALAGYPLWVANYVSTPVGNCPKVPNGWTRWHFWQYSESGQLAGVPADAVDLDVFDGSLDDLRAFAAASNVGAGGTAGSGGAGGTGNEGGAAGSSAAGASAGGAGGTSSGASGGSGATGTGATAGTSTAAPGCSVAPDCGACTACLDVCLCHGGDWPGCVDVCGTAPSGSAGASGDEPPGGSSSNDSGCTASRRSTGPGNGAAWLAALIGACTAGRRRRR